MCRVCAVYAQGVCDVCSVFLCSVCERAVEPTSMYTTLHAKAVMIVPAEATCITKASTRDPVRCMHTASSPTAPEKAWSGLKGWV